MNQPSFLSPYIARYPSYRCNTVTDEKPPVNLNWSIDNLLNKIVTVTTSYDNSTDETVSKISDSIYISVAHNSKQNKEKLQQKIDLAYNNIKNVLSTLSIDFQNKNTNKHHKPSYLQKLQAKLNASTPFSATPNTDKWCSKIKNSQKTINAKPIVKRPTHPQRRKIRSLFTDSAIKEVASSTIISKGTEQETPHILQLNIRQVKQSFVEKIPIAKANLSLEEFQMGHRVGSGKFGEVYLCRHRKTGLIFALKKIFKSTIKKYNMQSQFLLQMKILYMLDHPNIIKLYAHFSDQYHLFLLMEYVEGGQLLTRLQSNEQYVSQVINQMIDAIEYIHSLGVVHRDIKPENIVMSFENTAKLCDFGWAGHFTPTSMKSTYCGTLDYVSPEMKDEGKYTNTVDLWSLGVLTFELLVGNAPFRQQITKWMSLGSHRSVPWSWNISYPAQISEAAQSFIKNLLKQKPDERASTWFCKKHFFIIIHNLRTTNLGIELHL